MGRAKRAYKGCRKIMIRQPPATHAPIPRELAGVSITNQANAFQNLR